MRYLLLFLVVSILVFNGCKGPRKESEESSMPNNEQSSYINNGDIQYNKWNLSGPIFTARHDHSLDNVAVKDPSIVYYQARYHLFYTAKSMTIKDNKARYSISCAYASAETLDKLNHAKRYSIDSIVGTVIIAPQIFYFEPQKLWYLIAHTPKVVSNLSTLTPIYLTNPNIEDVNGWSEAKEIQTGRIDDKFWIDFWVICDDENAYMFYSDQKGAVLRLECPLNTFPEGFSNSKPELALYVNYMNEDIAWKMFEAVHIYYVKKENKYLALLEGAYKHPARKGDVDARSRFIFGMIADSLNGKWERIEVEKNEFLAEAKNLFFEDGGRMHYTQVSHPELIRSGYDQKLEIEDYNLTMLFQTFDGSGIPDTYNYNELPWELVLMKIF